MACATINYLSKSLEKASAFHVIFPEDPKIRKPWSVFYLLHGLSDDYTYWMRQSCIERYVADLPLAVVMPDGGRGWYTNAQVGDAYEDDLIKDVVGLVDRTFPVKAERAGRAIGGLSMGGFGAVKLGLKYPDMFASVTSHSGTLGLVRDVEKGEALSPEFKRIFGEAPKDGPEDPFSIVQKLRVRRIPSMRIDCGIEDPFLDQNRDFHEHLEKLNVPHEYVENPGTHEWSYWDLQVREALAFHVKTLGI